MEIARPRKFWVNSQSDPRWNFEGSGVCTRFETPKELEEKLAQLRKKYGEQPKDLRIGYY